MAISRFVAGLALAMCFGSGSAWAAACSGNWVLATESGNSYQGSAIHVGNKIVFLGELQDSLGGATLHLDGQVQPGTNQVIFENADRAGQLFSAEIASGCGVIRGYAQANENRVYFTMTKVVVEQPVQTYSTPAAPPQDLAETAEAPAPADEFFSAAPAQTPPPAVRSARSEPQEEKKGFFRRLWPFGDDDDEDEIKREKDRVLIHRERLGKNF